MDDASQKRIRLEVTGLTKSYSRGRRAPAEVALRALDMRLAPGELLLLAGPNGAGKSTALRLFAGLDVPDEGRVLLDGNTPRSLAARRATAWLPDNTELFPFLDWRETLEYFAALTGIGGAAMKERRDALGETWGLTGFGRKRVGGYSLGMRRRLALATVLIGRPDLLLLDEPISGLDPEGQAIFSRELRLEKERGATVVMSSHNFANIDDYADFLLVLRGGETVLQGRLDEIAERCHSRDLTVTGLDAESWSGFVSAVEALGGRVTREGLPRAEIESLVLGDSDTPEGA